MSACVGFIVVICVFAPEAANHQAVLVDVRLEVKRSRGSEAAGLVLARERALVVCFEVRRPSEFVAERIAERERQRQQQHD